MVETAPVCRDYGPGFLFRGALEDPVRNTNNVKDKIDPDT